MAEINSKKYHSAKAKSITRKTIIYIVLVVICLIWLVPYAYLISKSFEATFTYTSFLPNVWTVDNYVKLFTDGNYPFWKWFINTFLIALANMVLQTILTLVTSYTLSRLRFKGRTTLMKMMLILGMFPGFLGMIANYFIIGLLGLDSSLFALIILYAAGSAMNYYISKGFFDTIPKSLDEAVLIDGGNKNTVFWRIILPLSKPIVVYTLLMSFNAPWGDFMMASYIAKGRPNMTTVAVGLQKFVELSTSAEYFTRFCAGAVIVSLPIMILFFILQQYYVEGITGGAVKG